MGKGGHEGEGESVGSEERVVLSYPTLISVMTKINVRVTISFEFFKEKSQYLKFKDLDKRNIMKVNTA